MDSKEAYVTFCGAINPKSACGVMSGLGAAAGDGYQKIHLLFQTEGGSVSEAVCLYNFFKSLPVDLVIYNCGGVRSAGMIAYLGASKRICSAYATFMMHQTIGGAAWQNAHALKSVVGSIKTDDDISLSILTQNTLIPAEVLNEYSRGWDVWLTSSQSLDWGIATEISEWNPPRGEKIFNVTYNA